MEKIKSLLSTYKTFVVLSLTYALSMAIATYIEKKAGTAAAKILVYYSPLFIGLQFLMVTNFVLITLKKRFLQRKKWSLLIIHGALIIVLIGAFTTHVFSKEGEIHLREGEIKNTMIINSTKERREVDLPFSVELITFRIERYPGSNSPSSYESDLLVHTGSKMMNEKLYMNKIIDVEGYRLFQASYDEDEKGTLIMINQDVAGRWITYFGYTLLLIGFVMMFLNKTSRYGKLSALLVSLRKTHMFVLLLLCISPLHAQKLENSAAFRALAESNVPTSHVEKFASLPVQLRGRIVPMNTFTSEILRKVHKKDNVGGMNSDRFFIDLLARPHIWVQIPFIANSNADIATKYNLSTNYLSYSQVFDHHGEYKLRSDVEIAANKPLSERNNYDKEVLKLDEKVNTLFLVFNHRLPAIFPNADDSAHTWYAAAEDLSHFSSYDAYFVPHLYNSYINKAATALNDNNWAEATSLLNEIREFQYRSDHSHIIHPQKIKIELAYNQLQIFSKIRIAYFVLGGILLILAFTLFFNENKMYRNLSQILKWGIVTIFLCHLSGLALRGYISGYAPWSNSYETMVYVSWVTVLAALLIGRNNYLTLSLGTIFGGVILFVSGLQWMDPQITPLVPVLKSPWLMFHVAIIVAAYGFFGISFLLGIVNMSIMSVRKPSQNLALRFYELHIINNLSLLIGLVLLTIGTFMGAVWANESWGRYWSWDPKETWALITIMIYTILTHLHLVEKWYSIWLYNFLSAISFASVLMTYLGVNYFLSGMHSYGQNDYTSSIFYYITVVFILISILGIVSYKNKNNFVIKL